MDAGPFGNGRNFRRGQRAHADEGDRAEIAHRPELDPELHHLACRLQGRKRASSPATDAVIVISENIDRVRDVSFDFSHDTDRCANRCTSLLKTLTALTRPSNESG